jgi:hypothetical protein
LTSTDDGRREQMSGDSLNSEYLDSDAADEYARQADADADERLRRDRRRRTLIAAAIVVALVVLILLLLRSCATVGVKRETGPRNIVAVPESARTSEVISVWIEPKTDSISAVLARNGIRADQTVNMGEGLHFIFLADRENPELTVARLRKDSKVYDAGFAYDAMVTEPIQSTKP